MPLLRIVLDANVIISALIRPDSTPGRILREVVDGDRVCLITSGMLLHELQAMLRYPRLQRYIKMSPRDIEEFVILLEQLADPVSLHDYPATGTCRDPKDEPYLQTAMAGRADFIVSGDNDLLALKSINNTPIIPPAEFERVMKKQKKKF
jgi:uncharacterized protein